MLHRSRIPSSLLVACLVYTCLLPLPARSAGCATPVSASPSTEPLTADELRSLLIGNTTTWETCCGYVYHVYYAPGGFLNGKFKARYYDTGTWEITAKQELCRKWHKWKESAIRCFRVYRTDNRQYLFETDSDNFISTVDIRPDDPERLAD